MSASSITRVIHAASPFFRIVRDHFAEFEKVRCGTGEHMNYGKSLEEVWAWRETVAKELLGIPREKRAKYLNKTAHEACKRLGIKCRVMVPRAHARVTVGEK